MALLSVQKLNYATGAVPTLSDAALTDTVNDCGDGHNMFLWYKNTDTNAKTVTITAPGNTDYGQANPDPAFTLSANTGQLMIPLHPDYIDSTGIATITITGTGGVTGVTVAYVRTP